ncbi:DUF2244 domain-containing protein [Hoeflea prorocentri]|uniref:DUF2244 domain-containing protein n=1 Tax=Hoeflea prorocentri TaxID=1922333 RepID=A0A9X3ULN6_9HYPH|nr:DUF2244 domain-containing protein [Hoeflea prorocentri]MCY6383048.1 DUF2244 domain-containing protein [Hoeflea prorocentri]MDA5400848.1 DUF2244 domain-containing protein [Hoeflea prorocentri]
MRERNAIHGDGPVNKVRDNEAPVFEALLTPHRSLSRTGFVILMVIVVAATAFHGLIFAVAGAWPVTGFFIFDLVLLGGAFWLNYRAARAREVVSVSRTDLSIRKVAPSGRVREHRFNPFWARFHIARHEEFGITGMRVTGEGRSTDVGSFLNPDDRESFAQAFAGALATVRRN